MEGNEVPKVSCETIKEELEKEDIPLHVQLNMSEHCTECDSCREKFNNWLKKHAEKLT